jgi:hypothetical protein
MQAMTMVGGRDSTTWLFARKGIPFAAVAVPLPNRQKTTCVPTLVNTAVFPLAEIAGKVNAWLVAVTSRCFVTAVPGLGWNGAWIVCCA